MLLHVFARFVWVVSMYKRAWQKGSDNPAATTKGICSLDLCTAFMTFARQRYKNKDLGAVYTYVFASDSLSDLHANRMPSRFSVQFPIRHQSNSILHKNEIIDKKKLGSSTFWETTFNHPGPTQQVVGQRIGYGIG
jgi:hypothetical protein